MGSTYSTYVGTSFNETSHILTYTHTHTQSIWGGKNNNRSSQNNLLSRFWGMGRSCTSTFLLSHTIPFFFFFLLLFSYKNNNKKPIEKATHQTLLFSTIYAEGRGGARGGGGGGLGHTQMMSPVNFLSTFHAEHLNKSRFFFKKKIRKKKIKIFFFLWGPGALSSPLPSPTHPVRRRGMILINAHPNKKPPPVTARRCCYSLNHE